MSKNKSNNISKTKNVAIPITPETTEIKITSTGDTDYSELIKNTETKDKPLPVGTNLDTLSVGTYIAPSKFKEKKSFTAGMLTGQAIMYAVDKGDIVISGFNKKNINPNSYNLTLSPLLKVYENKILDSKGKNPTKRIIIPEKGFILQPGELYIGATNERTYSSEYIPQIEGRSTFGRLGLTIHITAGFGDLGFDGTWTLEITVIKPLIVYPNMEIAQISYFTPYGETNIQYDGRYQGQVEPVGARSEYNKKVYIGE